MKKRTGTLAITVDGILVHSQEAEIEALAGNAKIGKEINWKPAIILSATYLEELGIDRLNRYFGKKETKKTGKMLQEQSLPLVADLLYGLDLVNEQSYCQMKEIWKERIKIVHPAGRIPREYVGQEANRKCQRMIHNALRIIQSLREEEKGSQ